MTSAPKFPLEVQVGLQDSASEKLKKKLEAAVPKSIGDRLTEYGKKAEAVGNKLASMGKRAMVGLAAAGGGMYALANSTALAGDRLAKTSDRLGWNIEALQEWEFAAERSGIAGEKFGLVLQGWGLRLGQLKARQGSLFGFLGAVAPELRSQLLASQDAESAFRLYLDAIDQIPDQSKQLAMASAAFGEQGMAILNLANVGSKGIGDLREQLRRYGVMTEDQARSSERFMGAQLNLKAAFRGVRNTLGAELLPTFTELFNRLGNWLAGNQDKLRAWAAEWGEKLPGKLEQFGKAAEDGWKRAQPIVQWLADTVTAIQPWHVAVVGGTVALGTMLAAAGALAAGLGVLWSVVLANPFGLLAGAIAGVWLAFENWDKIMGWMKDLWSWVTRIGDGIASWWNDKVVGRGVAQLQGRADAGAAAAGVPAMGAPALPPPAAPAAAADDRPLFGSLTGGGAVGGVIRVEFANLPQGAAVSVSGDAARRIQLDVGHAMAF